MISPKKYDCRNEKYIDQLYFSSPPLKFLWWSLIFLISAIYISKMRETAMLVASPDVLLFILHWIRQSSKSHYYPFLLLFHCCSVLNFCHNSVLFLLNFYHISVTYFVSRANLIITPSHLTTFCSVLYCAALLSRFQEQKLCFISMHKNALSRKYRHQHLTQ